VQPWSSITPLTKPREYVGATTAVVASPLIDPVATAPRSTLPAVVTDIQGTKVTVTSTDRILALDLYGTLSATVFGLGLGDRLVGRDESTGFPQAANLPIVTGNGHQLNAEALLALHPSVLITDTTLGPWNVVLQIRDAGIPVVVVDSHRSLGNVSALVDQVSAALGVAPEGALLKAKLAQNVADERAQIDRIAPKEAANRLRVLFLYVRGQAGVYYQMGKGSGADSLIDALGAVDIASEAGVTGLSPLNAEALARMKPDVLVVMTSGLQSVGGIDGLFKLPGVAQTPAAIHRRVVDVSDFQLLSFGPLSAQVLDGLARALYAPDSVQQSGRA
jgi:iron complex transport system substrate-binding protein